MTLKIQIMRGGTDNCMYGTQLDKELKVKPSLKKYSVFKWAFLALRVLLGET